MPKLDIYKQLYTIASKHFNVDPHNIIDDLIVYHLKIKPENIKREELAQILDWLEIAAYLIIGNSSVAKDFMSQTTKLAGVG